MIRFGWLVEEKRVKDEREYTRLKPIFDMILLIRTFGFGKTISRQVCTVTLNFSSVHIFYYFGALFFCS